MSIDANTKLELGTLWLEGCNTSLRPESISDRSYVWGINVDNTRGEISTRPGFSQLFQTVGGNIQMLEHFRDADNTDWVVAAVNGRIYAALHPFTDWMIISENGQGIDLDPEADYYTHAVVERGACRVLQEDGKGETKMIRTERYIIISDGGKNPPVYFDGSRLRQSDPENYGIPKCSWMAYVKDRLWIWDTEFDCLKYSDIHNPITFYAVTFMGGGLGYTISSPCFGMQPAPDESGDLLVFEREKTWLFRTSSDIVREGDWKRSSKFQSVLFPHVGCLSGKSFTYHYGDLWWWSNRGLVSLRRATNTLQDDELNPTDLEMTRSRKTFGNGTNQVVGVSHDNYLLISTPLGDIWAKNNSPASLLNSDTAPAWMGVWTGLRAKAFCSFISRIGNQRWTMAFSEDFDGKNRIWKLFNGTQQDNGQPIKCFAEFKAHPIAGLYTRKRFGSVSAKVHGIWGDVNVRAFYKGTRGSWKKIMETNIRAATTLDGSGDPVTQSRDISTPEVTHRNSCNCGEESGLTDNVDGAFQVMFRWEGQMSIGSYQMVAYEDVQDFTGRCMKDEENPVTVHTCAAISYTYQPAYIEQSNLITEITFESCRVRCLPYTSPDNPTTVQTTTWDIISPGNTPDPTVEEIRKVVECDPNDFTGPTKEYTSTQTVTVYCIDGSGAPITKTATATSDLSQVDADEKAKAIARAEADDDLLCNWTVTASYTAVCPNSQYGNAIVRSATFTSTISREDAEAGATELAKVAAEAELVCEPIPSNTYNPAGSNWTNSGNPATIPGQGSMGRVNFLGRPTTPWSGGVGANGQVTTIGPNWICGEFTKFDGQDRKNLAKVGSSGAIDLAEPDFFRTPTSHPDASNIINQHLEGADDFVAVTGLIRSFNGQRIESINPARVSAATYMLINPATNSIVSVGGYGSGIAGQLGGGTLLYSDNFHNRYLGYNSQFVRVFQNGTVDTSFITNYEDNGPLTDIGQGFVFACGVDSSRKLIYVAGDFTKWGKIAVPSGICRLNWDGTLDTSFVVSNVKFNPQPRNIFGSLTPTSPGTTVDYIYVAVTLNTSGAKTVVKINPSGSIVTQFRAPSGCVPLRAKPHPNPDWLFVRNQDGEEFRVDPVGTNTTGWLTNTTTTQSEILARKHILMLDINTGQPVYAFNSDADHSVQPGQNYDFTNPGSFKGPVTGLR